MKRPFNKLPNRERERIMRDSYITYSIQADLLKEGLASLRAEFERSIQPETKVLAELNTRMASLIRELRRDE
jgi:hypothetical protein